MLRMIGTLSTCMQFCNFFVFYHEESVFLETQSLFLIKTIEGNQPLESKLQGYTRNHIFADCIEVDWLELNISKEKIIALYQ